MVARLSFLNKGGDAVFLLKPAGEGEEVKLGGTDDPSVIASIIEIGGDEVVEEESNDPSVIASIIETGVVRGNREERGEGGWGEMEKTV